MKNLNHFKNIIFSLMLFLMAGYANAYTPPSQKNNIAFWSVTDQREAVSRKTGKKIECTIPFAELNYVGVQFEGEAICVYATNDAAANTACRKGGSNYRIINPGNPQYQDSISGTRDTNPAEFYYCVPDIERNRKQFACEQIAPKESIYKREEAQIEFKWFPARNNDGDCKCGLKGASGLGFRECDRDVPRFPDMCAPLGLTKASDEEYMKLAMDPKAGLSCGPMACKCSDGRVFDVRNAKDECAKPPERQNVAATTNAPTAGGTRPPVEDTLDSTLKLCVDDWKAAANKCKTVSDEAKKECGTEEKSQNADTSKVIDAASSAYMGSKSGTGAQQECFQGSLIANYAKGLLSEKSEACNTKTASCASSCKAEEINKEKERCYTILQRIVQERYGSEVPDNKNSQYFTEGEQLANQLISQGENVCGEAKASKSAISSGLDSLGKSLAASVQCMCKLSNGGTGPCDKIVPPSDCAKDASLPGCRQYGSLGVCTPGSGYDAKLCACQTNPKGAGCPGGDVSGGLSNFATGGNLQNGNGGADIGSPLASDLKPSSGDLGSLPSESGPASNLKLEPTKIGSANPGGGSSPGGGASSGGGPESGEPPAEEEGKSGIRGLFGAAKNFVSNALGGKKSKGNGDSKLDSKSKFDPNKFRPVRGVAGKDGIGSKNQDIWKMVNTCLYSETCASNSNSFLESPLKHK